MSAPNDICLGGLLGAALDANLHGRLAQFIIDETSPAIELFSPARRDQNLEGDWYGEHAGKWLVAAAKAAARSGDVQLRANVLRVADFLVSVQEPDGYLGTYATERRFMRPQPPKPASWDGAPSVRTWDIWTHAYLILGLLEVHHRLSGAQYLEAACKIGDLCWRTLADGDMDITELGNHHGMSATILLDPAVELYFVTGEKRYLDLATRILEQANGNRDLALLDNALAGFDASAIGTGKAYQLVWNLVGLAKLHRATGEEAYLRAVQGVWENIRAHHLTLGGGPWGGVGHRSREVFNPAGVFSPYGYVETCSTFAWIQLNRELLAITGEARYAEEVEHSAYNDLLGAQAPDGEDWCYYVFPNGRRVHTTYWRCCKSSGAMALEELPDVAVMASAEEGIVLNVYGPSVVAFDLAAAGRVRIVQETTYPYDGFIRLRLAVERESRFALKLRIPSWADGATVSVVGDASTTGAVPGQYAAVDRQWQDGDEVVLTFPMQPTLHHAVHYNVQESLAPDGSEVKQEVIHFDYVAISRGPLVFATDLIDGFKAEETVRLPVGVQAASLSEQPMDADGIPRIRFAPLDRAPLIYSPYFMTGGRVDGAWRLTWLQKSPLRGE